MVSDNVKFHFECRRWIYKLDPIFRKLNQKSKCMGINGLKIFYIVLQEVHQDMCLAIPQHSGHPFFSSPAARAPVLALRSLNGGRGQRASLDLGEGGWLCTRSSSPEALPRPMSLALVFPPGWRRALQRFLWNPPRLIVGDAVAQMSGLSPPPLYKWEGGLPISDHLILWCSSNPPWFL